MTDWPDFAFDELQALANSNPRASSTLAAQLFLIAAKLNPARVSALHRLPHSSAEIRYWDRSGYSVYVRVDGHNRYTVLHVGETVGALRVKSNGIAISRA